MRIEDQVVSLELAKELKTLGEKQDSFWYWVIIDGYFDYQLVQKGYDPHLRKPTKDFCSAFTVAELGEMLPQYAESYRIATNNFSCKFCELIEDEKGNPKNGKAIINVAKTEADARAKMLIYLIKNKLVEAE